MIYMDNAATTRLSSEAFEAMRPFMMEQYANPAGTYSFTNKSNEAMENARAQVASVIGAKSAEIFFTSGGTESDNWALKGAMKANEKKGRHLIISAIEHHAILHSAKALEREGFEVTVLPVDADGVVAPESVEAAIRPDTVLVSIMEPLSRWRQSVKSLIATACFSIPTRFRRSVTSRWMWRRCTSTCCLSARTNSMVPRVSVSCMSARA